MTRFISALAGDAVRLFVRGKTLPLLLASGAVAGLFVRATRVAGTLHVHGAPEEGGGTEIEMLASCAYVAALLFGVVAGLVLASEDRTTGFLAQVAVRPVGRVRYALGRLVGLALATAVGLVAFLAAAVPCSGIKPDDLPETRARAAPVTVEVDGRALEPDEVAQVRKGGTASFAFGAGAFPDVLFRLHPKVVPGAGFDGSVEMTATWRFAGGKQVVEELPLMRSFRELPLHVDGAPPGPFALDVTLTSPGVVVEVDVTALGAAVPVATEFAAAFVLLWAGAALVAALGFVLGLGLSAGPASLAAGFLLLIGSGRAAVLDIIAAIGASPQASGLGGGSGEGGPGVGANVMRRLRELLSAITRLMPDLSRFDPSERLGIGEAIVARAVLVALGNAMVAFAAALVLAALIAPLKEER